MILVTGADGMLGTWLTVMYPKNIIPMTHAELDITDEAAVESAVRYHKPDTLINAAGVTRDTSRMQLVNGLAPHKLSRVCSAQSVRFIQISSDCVFSGRTGGYTELDFPDADTIYGKSKRRGEIIGIPNQLTIRTSFIGWPDSKERGLLSWLYHQSDPVKGYTRTMWNGLTVWALVEYLMIHAYARTSGLLHLYGQTVSKYDVLKTANLVYNWDRVIEPQNTPVKDMTLETIRSDRVPLPETINLEQSLREMRKWQERVRAHLSR